MTISVVTVDDQTLIRSGIALMLSTENDIAVVGEATNGADAVRLAAELRPDIVLMDVEMPIMSGIDATKLIVSAGTSKVIVLTTFDRDDYLFDALQAGASGFLLKNSDPESLVTAIRTVCGGHALLAPEVTLRVIARSVRETKSTTSQSGTTATESAGLDMLTGREREVLALLARGHSNSEIAARLFVGESTVKTHISNVLTKLDLRNRVQAVVHAYESGFIRPNDDQLSDAKRRRHG